MSSVGMNERARMISEYIYPPQLFFDSFGKSSFLASFGDVSDSAVAMGESLKI